MADRHRDLVGSNRAEIQFRNPPHGHLVGPWNNRAEHITAIASREIHALPISP
jgi:hypothetical protein